jgi:prepilin-type N-terminal cleavage/methylation domain-containing protein
MKKNKGLSLIEIIVSIIIFGIAIVGIAMFNSSNTRTAVRSERNAKRIILQDNNIEDFKGWLKAAPVPGERFDDIWNNGEVGDTLFPRAEIPDLGIAAALVLNDFIPTNATPVTDPGVYLEVSVFSTDDLLGINEETTILISRHN